VDCTDFLEPVQLQIKSAAVLVTSPAMRSYQYIAAVKPRWNRRRTQSPGWFAGRHG
jgi:hypothetical protein